MANGKASIMDQGVTFVKENPIGSALMGLFLAAIIIPPVRRRKPVRKKRKKVSGKKAKRRLTKREYARKAKKHARKASKRRKQAKGLTVTHSRSVRPARMVKGSAAAKAHMARLRSLRKK
jgi:hypothetical protein